MKIALGPGEVIGLQRSVREHTESVMVGDLISDPLAIPGCLADSPENKVAGHLLYGSSETVMFDTQIALVVGDVITLPSDLSEYLVNSSFCRLGSNVEIFSVTAERDLPGPRGIRFADPVVAEWHANREIKRLNVSVIPRVDMDEL